MSSLKVKLINAFGLLLIFTGLSFSFLTNGFSVAPWNEWAVWERGSEAMVLQRIEVDLLGREAPALGLSEWPRDEYNVYERLANDGLAALESSAPETFVPYESEVGGQAHFWSFVWRDLGCSSVSCLHAVASVFSAAAVVAVFLSLGYVTSSGLAWAWLLSAALSPWIAFSARNLFWSPWLYFLPVVAAACLVVARSARGRLVALGGVFLAFLVKYMGTGYHEITAFTLMAVSIPLLSVAFGRNFRYQVRGQLVNALLVLASSALAFLAVLAFHAYLLAGNINTGLHQIWVNTILRRTHGAAVDYDPGFAAGLDASLLDVVWRYMWAAWSTDVLGISIDKYGTIFSLSIGRAAFIGLMVSSAVVIIFRVVRADRLWIRDSTLLVLGFAIPVVWFVLAKGYSFVHTHILFFLWYFLFIPALLFVTASFLWQYRSTIWKWAQDSVA